MLTDFDKGEELPNKFGGSEAGLPSPMLKVIVFATILANDLQIFAHCIDNRRIL
jgi:hypothetical protein